MICGSQGQDIFEYKCSETTPCRGGGPSGSCLSAVYPEHFYSKMS